MMKVWGERWNLGKHAPASQIRDLVGKERWEKSFTFSFVRHPVDRIVSLYTWTADLVERRGWIRWIGARLPEGLRCQGPWYRDGIWDWPTVKAYLGSSSFSEFIRHPDFERSPATKDQFQFVSDAVGETCIVDFVGKLNSIEQDFRTVCTRIGIKTAQLSKSNSSKRTHMKVAPADRRFLEKKYHRDFDQLGYERVRT
jgi:hypothetical protein